MYHSNNANYTLQIPDYTDGLLIGKVLKTQEELQCEDYVGFYIPKILGLVGADEGPKDESGSIDKGVFANNSDTAVTFPSSVPLINYIKVKYNGRSNFSQPIIALGESAHIFYFDGDYKQPRYTDSYNDMKKRKEDEIKLFANGKDNTDDEAADMYYVLLSGKDKKIQLHTSGENGEDYMYDIIIDSSSNMISIADSESNTIAIKTDDKSISLVNASGATIDVIDKDIVMSCDGDFSITCNNFSVESNNEITETASVSYTLEAPTIELSADAQIEVIAPMFKASVDSLFSCTAPMALFNNMLGAPNIGISVNETSPPTTQLWSMSGLIAAAVPMDMSSNAIKVLTALTSLAGFTLCPPAAASAMSALAALIPSQMIKQ
jgi:hypothetical protein